MPPRNHYYLSIADLAKARGPEPALSYAGAGPDAFASRLEESLRTAVLFERWKAMQDEPDEVDSSLGATDAQARVTAALKDLHIDVELVTDLPMRIIGHRLNLLIGASWQLRDTRAA